MAVHIEPAGMKDVAREIIRISDTLEDAQRDGERSPAAPGRDEVSSTAARTLRRMAAVQDRTAGAALRELTVLARAVEYHAGAVEESDADSAGVVTRA
ncbi:PE domain-containing protein [Tsukamurella sp. 8F]|uniref:PE domain-containing protein n=1 Tax=unclassified Tsukamurella TaxID=2633480 RepID=UPI0023B8F014|nr:MULTISPECIES: PE domain-containing protein [unclassified Tsukamurella]MDF0531746.1 PE domain-containing protein [Tsukamurella sp. 8J]MDF0589540.1 PE domain-containing protein [Tsukamurella sp. 8F]